MNYTSKNYKNYSNLSLLFTGCILVFGLGVAQAENHTEHEKLNKFEDCLQTANILDIKERHQDVLTSNIKVRQLCNNKQRNKAQNIAIGLALKLHRSKYVSRYRYCSKHYEDTQNKSFKLLLKYHVSKLRFTHICDVE